MIWLSALARMASIFCRLAGMPEMSVVRAGMTVVSQTEEMAKVQAAYTPFFAEARTVAVPAPTAVTLPVSSTRTTPVLLEVQVRFCGAVAGKTVPVRVAALPTSRYSSSSDSVTLIGTSGSYTVTVTFA